MRFKLLMVKGGCCIIKAVRTVCIIFACTGLIVFGFVINSPKFTIYQTVAPSDVILQIYSRLLFFSDVPRPHPKLIIIVSPQLNAAAHIDNVISINTGLLEIAETPSQIAGILAHELAHIRLGHLHSRILDSRQDEINADIIGLFLMQRAGYNPCDIPDLWGIIFMYAGFNFDGNTHPSQLLRSIYLTLPQCKVLQ